MKRCLFLLSGYVLASLTGSGQDFRLKAFFIPVFEHSVAAEWFTGRHLGFQLTYQNHNELGDNRYFHHRVMPSVRYYARTDSRWTDRLYMELYHRSAWIRHIPDQSSVPLYRYATQSLGLSAGKQVLFRGNRMLMDLSFGHYLIYAGDAKQDFSDFNFFRFTERNRWRIDIKLGLGWSARTREALRPSRKG
jgi:hypothetical protein